MSLISCTRGGRIVCDPFEWTEPYGIADHQQHCSWEGLELWAHPDGTWRVLIEPQAEGQPWRHRVGSDEQTPGIHLQDAQRRAQAAALILHQLRRF